MHVQAFLLADALSGMSVLLIISTLLYLTDLRLHQATTQPANSASPKAVTIKATVASIKVKPLIFAQFNCNFMPSSICDLNFNFSPFSFSCL